MSELLALSFDADASPVVRFREPGEGGARFFGWGLGWYPNSERGASVVKDPSSSGSDAVGDAVGGWKRFRSTLFLCHLRGHRRPRTQQDAQPFVRSYGGRQWIFAHDGDFAPGWEESLVLPDDPAFDPLGRTDSERAFCWLLARLHQRRARSLGDVTPEELGAWLEELNGFGPLNLILSDGDLLAIHRDSAGEGTLSWTRCVPPHPRSHYESEGVTVDLDDPTDSNRTGLIVSSTPLSRDEWLGMEPGQLMLVRRGSVLFSNRPADTTAPSAPTGEFSAGRVETSPQIAAAQPLPVSSAPPRERLLTVIHETHYAYAEPVDRSSHRLLLRPIDDPLQRVLDFSLETLPGGEATEYEDVFGNRAVHVELGAPYTELTVRANSRLAMAVPPKLAERLAGRRVTLPLVWMPWQRQMLQAYLLPAELPESQLEEISEFAMSFVERNDQDLAGTFQDMNQTLYRDFEYVSGSTTVATTPFEVFQSRRGVCQDFANLMICMARLLQVPARYRMGYIFTGAEYGNKIQSEASHAWVELYVPRLGWHGFDPTNGREVGSEHIRVACGRGYRDATPTAGTIYRGGGTETLTVTVRVEEKPD